MGFPCSDDLRGHSTSFNHLHPPGNLCTQVSSKRPWSELCANKCSSPFNTYQSRPSKTIKSILKLPPLISEMLFLEPIVLCLSIYIAFIYGVIFLFLLI